MSVSTSPPDYLEALPSFSHALAAKSSTCGHFPNKILFIMPPSLPRQCQTHCLGLKVFYLGPKQVCNTLFKLETHSMFFFLFLTITNMYFVCFFYRSSQNRPRQCQTHCLSLRYSIWGLNDVSNSSFRPIVCFFFLLLIVTITNVYFFCFFYSYSHNRPR